MKHTRLNPARTPLALLCAGLLSTPLLAGEHATETHIVKVRTADAEVVEADVTDLALGESRTFVTGSGHTVDLLQAPEGLEIYIDGELVETRHGAEDLHERIALLHERSAEACEAADGSACEEHYAYVYRTDAEGEMDAVVEAIGSEINVELVCADDDSCNESVWIDDDGLGDMDLEVLHESDGARVVIIEKHTERTD